MIVSLTKFPADEPQKSIFYTKIIIMNIIQEPGVMAIKVPENATDFKVEQPENIAFSSFQFTFKDGEEEHSENIDSNVEFSNVSIEGRCSELKNLYLENWCKKAGIEGESYVVLKLSY